MFGRFRTCRYHPAALPPLLLASILAEPVQVITETLGILPAGIVDFFDKGIGLHLISPLPGHRSRLLPGQILK